MLPAAQEPPDGTLVAQARQGDPEAFGELVRRYQASVFNVCYRLLGERTTAEDMAQEAFIRAHSRLGTFDVSRPFGPWMRRVAANVCLNHLERPALPSLPLDDEVAQTAGAASEDPAAAAEAAQTTQAVRAAILALPPRYRAVIELRHFQELSYDEIASALDRPLSDVKSDLFRARKLLAQALQPEELTHD
jgi:RNA polymerase sigma-70 factor (ECF subfamily)